jgi:6-phosphogluconolactonase
MIAPDAGALAQMVARHIVDVAAESVAKRGRFTFALAGGSTPRAAYAQIARAEYRDCIDWTRTEIFWSDERCVPPDHPDSNYRMAQETLLEYVPIMPQHIHRVPCERSPQEAAASYAQALDEVFADRPTGSMPRFDLIMLGMGDDGHTASLFPGTPAVHETARPVVAHYVDALDAWRVTFTPAVINAAAHVAFVVSGEDKAARLRDVWHGPYQPDVWPAQVVRPIDGRLLWLVDQPAAARLDERLESDGRRPIFVNSRDV